MNLRERIGRKLGTRREQRGISYAELARRTRMNEDMVARFCKGASMPKADQLVLLCRELGLDVEDFGEEEAV